MNISKQNSTLVQLDGISEFQIAAYILGGLVMFLADACVALGIMTSHRLRGRTELSLMSAYFTIDCFNGLGALMDGAFRLYAVLSENFGLTTSVGCLKRIFPCLYVLSQESVAVLLLLISVDRLIAVERIALYLRLGRRYLMGAILLPLSLSIVSLMFAVFLTPKSQLYSDLCVLEEILPSVYVVVHMSLMCGCSCLGVFIYLLLTIKFRCRTAVDTSDLEAHKDRQRRVTKTLLVVSGTVFGLQTVPLALKLLLSDATSTVYTTLAPFLNNLIGIHSLVTVICYLYKQDEVREHLRNILTWRLSGRKETRVIRYANGNAHTLTFVNQN